MDPTQSSTPAGDALPLADAESAGALSPESEPSTPAAETGSDFAFASLDAVRNKLLDLSGRNQLLNYRHPRASCVRVIDELPDQMYLRLQLGKALDFVPVPDPTEKELLAEGYIERDAQLGVKELKPYPSAEQWAARLGLDTGFDLPEAGAGKEQGKHQNRDIQTLLYASELEARLRDLRVRSETAIEESGGNVLYLVMGFLEWHEDGTADSRRLAPLFTVPVRLARTRLDTKLGVYRYAITLKDESLLTNVTLREKLGASFNLVLPDVEEDTTPEAYFRLIEAQVLPHQPRWRLRRMATLAVLNFAKQVMYQDLDPNNWPEQNRIEDHPIVSRFFSSISGRARGSAQAFREEHLIDNIDDVHQRFPIIYDADSSQHSALIDAVNGESLVIEGPPGSGKSQTITNLIAACIANGKKVLFVAEKMAALNVVKDRLERAGLGDFCLELHSHKTQKQKLLEDLKSRIEKQDAYATPENLDADIARVEDLKNKLKEYVDVIHSKWKFTGMTLHAILNRAARFRQQLSLDPETLTIAGLTGEDLSLVRQRELLDQADILAEVFALVHDQAEQGPLAKHPWFGVNNADLLGYEEEELLRQLAAWSEDLRTLAAYLREINDQYALGIQINLEPDAIHSLAGDLRALPELKGDEPLALLPTLMTDLQSFKNCLTDYTQIHDQLDELALVFKAEALTKPSASTIILEQIAALKALGLTDGSTPTQAYEDFKKLKDAEKQARALAKHFTQIAPGLPENMRGACDVSEAGLGEFLSLLRLLKQLPSELWRLRDPMFDAPEMDSYLSKMVELFRILMPLHVELSEHFDLARLPASQTLTDWRDSLAQHGMFSFLSPNWRHARKGLFALANSANPNKDELVGLLQKLVVYRKGVEQIDRLHQVEPVLGGRYQGMDTPLDSFVELRKWYKSVREEYGLGFSPRTAMGEQLIAMDKDLARALLATAATGIEEQARQLHDTVGQLRLRYNTYKPLQDKSADLAAAESPLRQLIFDLHKPLRLLLQEVSAADDNLQHIAAQAGTLADVQNAVAPWQQSEMTQLLVPEHLNLQLECGQRSQALIEAGWNTFKIANIALSSEAIGNSLRDSPAVARYNELRECARLLQERVEWAAASFDLFLRLGKVDVQDWFGDSKGALLGLLARNDWALSRPTWLSSWLDYIRLRKKLAQEGMQKILDRLEAGELPLAQLGDVVQLAINHQLAREILREHPTLDRFSGLEQSAIRNRFREYDQQLMELQRQKIAYGAARSLPPEGNGSGKVGTYTETALIKHEASKKTRHIAVRSLLLRAGDAVAALKPCFMMSPMSVAQYLAPGQFQFDIVIMDEASQIRPEDALGAIARGRSLVVVGDPKQLPPTTFFQKLLEPEEAEDVVALEESESILDTVFPMFRTRRLRWHYRSRHESLIAFSNLHYYNSDLVLFPSPFQQSPEFGIRYQRIERGRFVRGKNAEEARALAKSAISHMLEHPDESVGLVAMNSEQRDEIERHVEELIKEDPAARAAYEGNSGAAEPLFIKNLENVQGDERDVIMISMTYGPDEVGGKVHQRFGPINSDMGWRRLNVLFTRAKKRMLVFTSMGSNDVIVSTNSKRGVISLRAFLEYCESGQLAFAKHVGRTQGSDFQIGLMRALALHGYACESQLGAAGYYLDVAVKDPGRPGRFLMGIECDGATYHSARSTRDRDRLRQQVLEGLGWRIRRIWSTDWFKNPEAQLQPILQELDALATPRPSLIAEVPTFALPSPASVLAAEDQPPVKEKTAPTAEFLPAKPLKEHLSRFEEKVIRARFPDTDEQSRLLRTPMLEALVQHLPTSKEEYAEVIPHYLRAGTDEKEAELFLDAVLEMVADYG